MKKILLFSALLFTFFAGNDARAQVSVNVNIGGGVYQQPAYYDDCDYYYMPQIGVYYNVARRLYVYNDCGRWVSAAYLPARWRGYSWNNGVRIYGRTPYMRHDDYRRRYADWGGRQDGWGRRDGGYYGGRRGGNWNNGYNNGGYNNGGNWNHGRNHNNGNWSNNGNNGNGNWNNGNNNSGSWNNNNSGGGWNGGGRGGHDHR